MKKLMLLFLCLILAAGCQAAPLTGGSGQTGTDTDGQAADWDYIVAKNELIVGLDDTFAPMGFRDEAGNLVGFDIDLAEAVGAELGVKIKFQPIDWSAKEMELSTKKIDCIWNGMSITPERQESMSLTRGYLNNRITVMMTPGTVLNSKEDLKNYAVGTQAESAALEMIMADPIFAELDNFNEYTNYDEVIMDMDAGRLQVMIIDEVAGLYKNSMRDNKLEFASFDFGDDFYAVGFRKEDTELTAKVEAAIDALVADGTATEISEKWFGNDIVIRP